MKKEDNSKLIKNDLIIELIKSFEKNENKNNIIDINSLYGIFLESNKFFVCKEEKSTYSDNLHLLEFFTDEFVESSKIRFNELVCPWHEGGKKYSLHFLGRAFYVPIVELLEENSIDEVISKKDILYLYGNINEYLRENPNFVEQLFYNENEKVR